MDMGGSCYFLLRFFKILVFTTEYEYHSIEGNIVRDCYKCSDSACL